RRDHARIAVAYPHHHPDPAEVAVGDVLETGIRLRVQVLGVGIELAQHSLERAVDELRRVHAIDVVLLDLVDHFHEQVEVGIEVGRGTTAARPPAEAEERGEQRHEEKTTADQVFLRSAGPPVSVRGRIAALGPAFTCDEAVWDRSDADRPRIYHTVSDAPGRGPGADHPPQRPWSRPARASQIRPSSRS